LNCDLLFFGIACAGSLVKNETDNRADDQQRGEGEGLGVKAPLESVGRSTAID